MILTRFAYSPVGTFGRLELPSGGVVYTVERPWRGNTPNVSCIPSGNYTLRKRHSRVVSRSTGGAYARGWEVMDVPGRSFIMFHPGNTMDDLEGCIAPGQGLGFVSRKWAVTGSQVAFERLMEALEGRESWSLTITDFVPEYP